jgi:hypothetical protein
MGMCKKIKKSRELAENHIFYDLAEFAPPNNPFDNSNPTTPRIGTNLLGPPPDPARPMEKITQARRVTRPRPRHSIGLSQDVIVLK